MAYATGLFTYHYTTTVYPNGTSSTVLTDVTETGYIWQRRTEETKEITIPISAELNQILDKKDQRISKIRALQDARIRLAKELSGILNAQKKVIDGQLFWENLVEKMLDSGANSSDIQTVFVDKYFHSINIGNAPGCLPSSTSHFR